MSDRAYTLLYNARVKLITETTSTILMVWVKRLAMLPEWLACTTLFALMLMTFSDVILRSAFNAPIEAATELTRLFMAIIVFSMLPLISARDGHIVVDLLDSVFHHPLLIRLRDNLMYIICGALLILPAERVSVLAERARSYGDTTEYLNIPQFYIAWFIAAMTFITAVVLIARGLLGLFSPSLIKHTGSTPSELEDYTHD